MANELTTIARTVLGCPDTASETPSERRNEFIMHMNPAPQRRTLVPKLKVWHEAELEEAVKAGSIFVTADQSGRKLMFTLAASAIDNKQVKVNLIDQSAVDAAETEHAISTDDIVHVIGPWPHYLSLGGKRPGGNTAVR